MSENPASKLKIEIADSDDHVRIEYRDLISMENQKRLIDIIHDMHVSGGKSKFVVNTKGCPIIYSVIERHQVAVYLAEKLKMDVAVAYIIDKANLTGIVENASHNRGGSRVKISLMEDEALDWIRTA